LPGYPELFISARLADWSPVEKMSVALGKVIVHRVGFFDSIKKGGFKNTFVELYPETFKQSAFFIHSL